MRLFLEIPPTRDEHKKCDDEEDDEEEEEVKFLEANPKERERESRNSPSAVL